MLPTGRVYGRGRLIKLNEKLSFDGGGGPGKIRDPMKPDTVYDWSEVKKVFVS